MKTIIITFFIFINGAFSQTAINIVGKWQCCDSLISAGYLNTYEFKNDSTFIYMPSEFDGDNSLLSISGNFKIISDTLILIITKISYGVGSFRIGNKIDEDPTMWVYEYDKTKNIKCKSNCIQKVIITVDRQNDNRVFKKILLNGFEYYKLIENLDYYELDENKR